MNHPPLQTPNINSYIIKHIYVHIYMPMCIYV
jgi:hypothetical protein